MCWRLPPYLFGLEAFSLLLASRRRRIKIFLNFKSFNCRAPSDGLRESERAQEREILDSAGGIYREKVEYLKSSPACAEFNYAISYTLVHVCFMKVRE